MKRIVVVLAAGKGTRMKSPLAKVLHPVLGRPLLVHLLEALAPLRADRTLVVVGHQAEAVNQLLPPFGAEPVLQEPQLGTGHALLACEGLLGAAGEGAECLLVAGDVPLLPVDEVKRMWSRFSESSAPAALVSLALEDPTGYGRLIRDGGGRLLRIVEERDASPEQKSVGEVNAGVYFFRIPRIFDLLRGVGTANAQGEYYLTDVFAEFSRRGEPAALFPASRPSRWLGVNTQGELARATKTLRLEIATRWMEEGVTVMDPGGAWIEPSVELAAGVILHPFVKLCGRTSLAAGVEVRSFSSLLDCTVGADTVVKENCVLEETVIGECCLVGPFSRTRTGTALEREVHLGAFVETKKAALGRGVKANHLSYLGDATVGAGSNIGAGTITCNYDGRRKHPTVLGDGVFIGSDTQLVAPVTVGDGAYVGAGTTVTKDVPPGALAISREPQKNLAGWVERKNRSRSD